VMRLPGPQTGAGVLAAVAGERSKTSTVTGK
jgi:hypothetical protein